MNLSIQSVSKQYRRDFWALRDFSLELESGVLGLLGPNGAGKSTLMRILATITARTEGLVCWNGMDISKHPADLRQVLGYLPQDFGVYPNLNAWEFLEYMAAIKGLDARHAHRRIEELLELLNLVDAANRSLGGYSGGMKQRIGIAQALVKAALPSSCASRCPIRM
jgi:ABC-2 type transport system ATP-binding protein